jgi:hypothetical protein
MAAVRIVGGDPTFYTILGRWYSPVMNAMTRGYINE